jgi:hypothetical protein
MSHLEGSELQPRIALPRPIARRAELLERRPVSHHDANRKAPGGFQLVVRLDGLLVHAPVGDARQAGSCVALEHGLQCLQALWLAEPLVTPRKPLEKRRGLPGEDAVRLALGVLDDARALPRRIGGIPRNPADLQRVRIDGIGIAGVVVHRVIQRGVEHLAGRHPHLLETGRKGLGHEDPLPFRRLRRLLADVAPDVVERSDHRERRRQLAQCRAHGMGM